MSEPSEITPYRRQKIHPPSESTAQFIKNYLLQNKKAYAYGLWKAWSEHLHRLGFKEPKIESFRKYLWILAKLDLIRKTKAPSYQIKSRFLREYYELNPKQIGNEKGWVNPSAALDLQQGRTILDPQTGKAIPLSKLGRRRYRKKVLGLPPKKVGRPRSRWIQSTELKER